MARKNKSKKQFIFLACFLSTVAICYACVKLLPLVQRYRFAQEDLKHPEEFVVTSKVNPQKDEDFFIFNKKTKRQIIWVTLSSDKKSKSFSGFYSGEEYRNGSLYLRRQLLAATNDGKYQLVVYDWRRESKKLISSDHYFDFEVLHDGRIAILLIDKLVFLDKEGTEILSFPIKELTVAPWLFADQRLSVPYEPWVNFINVSSDLIWLENSVARSTGGLVKLDINTYKIEKYDISDLGILMDFDFNAKKEKIASSGCPIGFETQEDEDAYKQSKQKEELTIYDLKTRSKELVATSIAKCFRPRWIDENTLEYDDPAGIGRLLKELP